MCVVVVGAANIGSDARLLWPLDQQQRSVAGRSVGLLGATERMADAVVVASIGLATQVVKLVYEIYQNHHDNSRRYTAVMQELAVMRPFIELRDRERAGSGGSERPMSLRQSMRLAKKAHTAAAAAAAVASASSANTGAATAAVAVRRRCSPAAADVEPELCAPWSAAEERQRHAPTSQSAVHEQQQQLRRHPAVHRTSQVSALLHLFDD